jgi:hypothetical protein
MMDAEIPFQRFFYTGLLTFSTDPKGGTPTGFSGPELAYVECGLWPRQMLRRLSSHQ